MKLLVCISKTPETTANISFVESDSKFNENGVSFIMNPYDEWYALVKAIEVKESAGGSVTVINVGSDSNDTIIRKALAIGADDAVRINADPQNAKQTAKLISEYIKTNPFDIVFLGKETIDYNGSEVGGMVAEYLDLPFLSYASHMEIEGNNATATLDIEGGVEVVKVATPFVVSAAKGMAEQRIPNMRGIMMAKRKPLHVIDNNLPESGVQFKSYKLPPTKSAVTLVEPDNMKELVRLLHEEAKVI